MKYGLRRLAVGGVGGGSRRHQGASTRALPEAQQLKPSRQNPPRMYTVREEESGIEPPLSLFLLWIELIEPPLSILYFEYHFSKNL